LREERTRADRAAPGATFAAEPVKSREEAEIVPSVAPGARKDARSAEAQAAPDSVAAARADAAGRRPESMTREGVGTAGDLQKISGIGPVIERTLNDLGIFTLEQVAAWTDENKAWVNAYLAFKGRIDRERWVEQARTLLEEQRGAPD
jgi:NADH-quinone oxidoreductase subunit E